MVEITFEIGGKRVNPRNIGDALERAILEQVIEHVKKAVGEAKCPDHDHHPKIHVHGRDLEHLSIDVSGCCQKFTDDVKRKLE